VDVERKEEVEREVGIGKRSWKFSGMERLPSVKAVYTIYIYN
jgi:hypothetical protein